MQTILEQVDADGYTTSYDKHELVVTMQSNYPPRDLRVYEKKFFGTPVEDERYHLIDMQNPIGRAHRDRLGMLLAMV